MVAKPDDIINPAVLSAYLAGVDTRPNPSIIVLRLEFRPMAESREYPAPEYVTLLLPADKARELQAALGETIAKL